VSVLNLRLDSIEHLLRQVETKGGNPATEACFAAQRAGGWSLAGRGFQWRVKVAASAVQVSRWGNIVTGTVSWSWVGLCG